ncbi:MAG: hypothetical protein GY842_05080, partial [bacterium]|nr:hypothetical protein [bacterium]
MPEWREGVCEFEEAYDRYQRVTVDNLSTGQSWDVSRVNVAPGTAYEPQPSLPIHTPWEANHLGLDQSGTGLLYTWDEEKGPVAVPFESPRF